MNETRDILINAVQAAEVIRLLESEIVTLRTRANRLIHNTNNRQAGFNVLDLVLELDQLAFLLADAFPEVDFEEAHDEG